MRITIVSDAWTPQVNGVARLVSTVIPELEKLGTTVARITPDMFRTIRSPRYPEIALAITSPSAVGRHIAAGNPDCIHIVTEGPLGLCARLYCAQVGLSFTSAFRTRYPEYLRMYFKIPVAFTYRLLGWFHRAAVRVMVSNQLFADELSRQGFSRLWLWPPGIDLTVFRPYRESLLDHRRPILLYVGRVALEKNLRAFLELDAPGTKVVVGDGPQLPSLRTAYPCAIFAGARFGEELARYYASADVLVFPSRTDTFGLVMLEALACGTPVAAFPEQGPRAVLGSSGTGCLNDSLCMAVQEAMQIPRERCRAYAEEFSWTRSAESLLSGLVPCRSKPANDARMAAQRGAPRSWDDTFADC